MDRDVRAGQEAPVLERVAVELENATDTNNVVTGTTPPGPAAAAAAPPRSSLVSLRVDLAAYFRRGAGSEVIEQPANATR